MMPRSIVLGLFAERVIMGALAAAIASSAILLTEGAVCGGGAGGSAADGRSG